MSERSGDKGGEALAALEGILAQYEEAKKQPLGRTSYVRNDFAKEFGDDCWTYQDEIMSALRAARSSIGAREGMPTDAVIRAICKYRGLDAGDKIDRADSSELWHIIQRASAPSARGTIIDGELVKDEKRIAPYFPTWQMKEAGGETLLQMVKEFAPEIKGLNAMQLAEGIYMEMLRHIPGLPYPENIRATDGGNKT